MKARAAGWVLILVGVATVPRAATAGAGLRLSIDACVPVNLEQVKRLVAIQAGLADDARSVRVDIACAGPQVDLEAVDPTNDRRVRRSLRLSEEAGRARARLLALAAVELAATVRDEGAIAGAAPESAPQGPEPVRSDALVPPAPAPAAAVAAAVPSALTLGRWRLLASGGGARFFSHLTSTGAAGLRLGRDGRHLGFSVDAQLSHGSMTSAIATTSATSASLAPALTLGHRTGLFTWRGGTGPRLALGRLRGESTAPGYQGSSYTAPWFAWLGQLGVSIDLGGPLLAELVTEGGYVVAPLGGRVDSRRAIAVEGSWLGGFVAFGMRL
jgi:hypothetical protein